MITRSPKRPVLMFQVLRWSIWISAIKVPVTKFSSMHSVQRQHDFIVLTSGVDGYQFPPFILPTWPAFLLLKSFQKLCFFIMSDFFVIFSNQTRK